jgi:iron complex transport system substrate-binding protein
MTKAAHILRAGLCAAALSTSAFGASDGPSVRPSDKPSLVSMDYCSDQFALALADPEQVIGLSPEADDVHSFYRDRADQFRQFDGSVEQVLHLQPDLVLRSYRGNALALELMQRLDIKIVSTAYSGERDIIFDHLEQMGAAMGQVEKTEALVADYRQRLAALQQVEPVAVRVAYITASGFTGGASTYVNSVIELAGFQSISVEVGVDGWAPIPLEAYLANPPDLIVASFFDLGNMPPDVWKIVRHPKFGALMADIPTIYIPGRYFSCSGYFLIDAAEFIRQQAQALGVIGGRP